ncbi:MAG: hypothetical protein GAK35_03780 [Herbaspirillum frisingense]|uniref:Uncharacterized protein n=1 Tax=Herbaspirillum frisingense TaxID=92645 RepID=A0A7V8JSI2_9BURK|nr:MAG: hypothetical protein GAK35_03780 [Herbaspirillum frisingense]
MLASPTLSVEAKLYAACGRRQLAPAEFGGLTRTLRESGASASVLRTDILKKEPVADLLSRIERDGCEPPMPPAG